MMCIDLFLWICREKPKESTSADAGNGLAEVKVIPYKNPIKLFTL